MNIKYMGLITVLFLAVAAIIFVLSGNPQTPGNSLEYTDQKSNEYVEPAPADTSPALPSAQATPSATQSGNPSTSGNSLPSGSSLSKPEISLSQTETQTIQPTPSGTSFKTTNIQTTPKSSTNSQTSIPEFQTLAIPLFSTIALMYLLFHQRQEK